MFKKGTVGNFKTFRLTNTQDLGFTPNLALDSYDKPHIVYVHYPNDGDEEIAYKKQN